MANWWDKPFSIEVDGQPWAVLTDKVALIGIRGPNKLPALEADATIFQTVQKMLLMKEKSPQTSSLERLLAFLEGKDYVAVKGVEVDTQRLGRVLAKIKKSKEVDIWDASSPSFFTWKCLGLAVPSQGWKAFLMGVRYQEPEPAAVYEFDIDPREMFDEVMGSS